MKLEKYVTVTRRTLTGRFADVLQKSRRKTAYILPVQSRTGPSSVGASGRRLCRRRMSCGSVGHSYCVCGYGCGCEGVCDIKNRGRYYPLNTKLIKMLPQGPTPKQTKYRKGFSHHFICILF